MPTIALQDRYAGSYMLCVSVTLHIDFLALSLYIPCAPVPGRAAAQDHMPQSS